MISLIVLRTMNNRDLCITPPFARLALKLHKCLRQAQISARSEAFALSSKYFNVFLRLKFPPSLNLVKIGCSSKGSNSNWKMVKCMRAVCYHLTPINGSFFSTPFSGTRFSAPLRGRKTQEIIFNLLNGLDRPQCV